MFILFSALKKSKRTAIDQLLSDDDDSDAEMFDDIDEMEEENESKVSIVHQGHKQYFGHINARVEWKKKPTKLAADGRELPS